MQYAHVAETDEAARDTFLPAFVADKRKYAELAGSQDTDWWDMIPCRWDPDTLDHERIEGIRRGVLVGSPETVAERLRAYERDVQGELHFASLMALPVLSIDERVEAFRRFGSEVIPRFND